MSARGAAQPLTPWRWLGVPMLQAAGATILLTAPLRFWGHGLPEPVFAMPAVFAWAVIRPSMLAPIGVMILGLLLDLVWGGPLGLWAVCLLLPYGAILAGRSMLAGQGRITMWAWYAVATALALGVGDLFLMFDVQNTPDPLSIAYQFLATVVLYPFADRLIERFEDADVRFR